MNMKKIIYGCLLGSLCAALALFAYFSKKNTAALQNQVARLEAERSALRPAPDGLPQQPDTASAGPALQAAPTAQADTQAVARVPQTAQEKDNRRQRMMRSISRMMENPTMNKVMEASQRGAISALYEDLADYLKLNPEERKYFTDVLMTRQMKQVDAAMKLMGGGLTADERLALTESMKQSTEAVKEEMKYFLNSDADYAEWEFYEKTMGERMMLSQVDKSLENTESALSDETYRQVLEVMHAEKENFAFTSNLADDKNMDMSPERFSSDNIANFAADMERLNANITERVRPILTPAQFEAFTAGMTAAAEMQQSQIEMAGQMFGGKKK